MRAKCSAAKSRTRLFKNQNFIILDVTFGDRTLAELVPPFSSMRNLKDLKRSCECFYEQNHVVTIS